MIASVPGVGGYEVVLLRHGETTGYDDDLGLSGRGERQAAERGRALAADPVLRGAGEIVLPHARSARATATAVAVRAELVAAGLSPGPPAPEPWFDNLRVSVDGEVLDANVATARRLRDPSVDPDWVRELDRFRIADHAVAAAGGPIEFWVRTPTVFFEPPALAAHRLWRGIVALAPPAGTDRVAVVATHSAPMRALLNTALGHDPGEPENLEPIRVRVGPGGATVGYRDTLTAYAGPPALPAWFDAAFLAAFGR